MEFSLRWRSQDATHNDRYFAPKVDFWRDIFPGTMEQPVASLDEGKCYEENFGPGELVLAFKQKNVIQFRASQSKTCTLNPCVDCPGRRPTNTLQ